jgi:excisionase family DNA binding protein
MSLRLAHKPEYGRAAISVQRAAELLDCSENTIRNMINDKQLQSLRLRGRIMRIFVDSIEDYQNENLKETKDTPSIKKSRNQLTANQREAELFLQNLGCI